MSRPQAQGYWRERARGVGLLVALSLSVLAVGAAIAAAVLVVLG